MSSLIAKLKFGRMDVSDISVDEREDGEIVDEFDAISDYSIPSCGKSDYTPDLLRALSLSSISDCGAEDVDDRRRCSHRKRLRSRADHIRRKKRRKRGSVRPISSHKRRLHDTQDPDTSCTESERINQRMLLKEAVRINTSMKIHHNSLRSRLKGMIEHSSEDENLEALRALALLTTKPGETTDLTKVENSEEQLDVSNDKELAELRSEALKSAVIKKHLERKKRKEMLNNDLLGVVAPSTNENNDKENAESNIIVITESDEQVIEKSAEATIEEDPDIMRAMLLASMSNKITSKKHAIQPVSLPFHPKTHHPIRRKQPAQINHPPLKIQPLIISLRDSDSESEQSPTKEVDAKQNPIADSVTEFLKKQREQYEAKEVKTKILEKKSMLEKMPVDKRQEYIKLKRQLIMKKRLRRLSAAIMKDTIEKTVVEAGVPKPVAKQVVQQNGRLQIAKGKYSELAPLIAKTNNARLKKKRCELQIEKLLQQLKKARTELADTQLTYTTLVCQLNRAKGVIDLRNTNLAQKKKPVAVVTKTNTIETQTPKPEPAEPVAITTIPSDVSEAEKKDSENCDSKCPKYVSPLDNRSVPWRQLAIRSAQIKLLFRDTPSAADPLQMMCPYELFGVCKDRECKFNHCP